MYMGHANINEEDIMLEQINSTPSVGAKSSDMRDYLKLREIDTLAN